MIEFDLVVRKSDELENSQSVGNTRLQKISDSIWCGVDFITIVEKHRKLNKTEGKVC